MHISIADEAVVHLKNATIQPTTGTATAAIICLGNATLILEGENIAKGMENKSGIQAGPAGKTLIIDGTGAIEAQCLASDEADYTAAAIGSSKSGSCGSIKIKNGIINAKAGSGAAIGSGANGSCEDIIIENGTVVAKVEQIDNKTGAGIGSGREGACGNITITGGNVTATTQRILGGFGHPWSAGIGSSGDDSSCGNILISGGTVIAKCHAGGAGATGGAAGIGTGSSLTDGKNQTCGNITISGGDVTATSFMNSAGIGLGHCKAGNVTIGNINISGGKVYAIGTSDDIGKGPGGAATITIGTVTVAPAPAVTWDNDGTKGYTPTATGYNRVP